VIPENLKESLTSLPQNPGIYKYHDKKGVIIYVGKAKNVKKRVVSYFTKQHGNRKTAHLVAQIISITYTVVDTEFDALLLENSLIKEFQPKYNINLKDDKSYPLIKITNERFPKVYAMRNPVADGSEYFGPYSSVRIMHTVLDLIKQLYPIRDCNLNLSKKNIDEKKFKVCLSYQIGNCLGPCEALQTETEYDESIKSIKHLLKGNLREVEIHLKSLMNAAAVAMQYEKAQQFKDKLYYLQKYQAKSTIVSHTIGNVDVFNAVIENNFAFVNFLRVNNGIVVQTRNIEMRIKLEEDLSEVLLTAIAEVHAQYATPNKEIIVPILLDLEENRFLQTIPKLGDKKKLLDLSLKNCLFYKNEKLSQYEKLNPDLRIERVMTLMQKDLRLIDLPLHIECFDNSNLQGTNPVSACVVFRNGKPSKKEYRIFNVKTVEGPNDFATMYEVVSRRYSRLLEENTPLPQLILIDGGKGQLSSAVAALKDINCYGKIAIIGIAKRLEELFYPEDPVPLYIDKKSETLKILQQLRDEAHRFGIAAHRKKRNKANFETVLDQIPGIGEERKTALLRKFKSVKKIKEQNLESLAAIVGKAAATQIVLFFEHLPM